MVLDDFKINLNTIDNTTSVIEINVNQTTYPTEILENYIEFYNFKFGESNNNFIIYGNDNYNSKNKDKNIELFKLNKDFVEFNQEVKFTNLNVINNTNLSNIYINGNFNTSNSLINLNDSIIIENSNININNLTNFNETVSFNKILVDNIDTNNSNIIIEKLKLLEPRFTSPQIQNNIDIIRNQNISSNIINIDLENIDNISNILSVNDILNINNEGAISINNDMIITSNSIKSHNFYLNPDNHLTIGKNKNFNIVNDYHSKLIWENCNNSLLDLHRNDNYTEYKIIKDPLINLSIDYNLQNNKIYNNFERIPLNFKNLDLSINNNLNQTDLSSYKFYFNLLPIFNNQNIDLYPNINNNFYYINHDDNLLTSNHNIELYFQNYDYDEYNLLFIQNHYLLETVSSETDNFIYNIQILSGFYKNNNNTITDILDLCSTNFDNINSNFIYQQNNNFDYISYNCNLIPLEQTANISLNITFHIIFEKTVDISYMYYIDKNERIIECPSFLNLDYNNTNVANINSNGLLKINDLDVKNTAYISNIEIDNINKDINLNNNNITNISNLDTLILHTDLLKIGDAFEISKENGIKNIKTTTINKFNLVDISNLDSSFLKYNDERTLILNNLNVSTQNTDLIRQTNNINEQILISNNEQNIIYIDGNTTFNGILYFNNNYINYFNIKVDVDSKLKFKDNNDNSFIEYGNNLITLGEYGLFNMTREINNNKIWIGDHSQLLINQELNNPRLFNTTKIYSSTSTLFFHQQYKNYFHSFYDNTISNQIIEEYSKLFPINIFSNVRFASNDNKTLIEIKEAKDGESYTNVNNNTISVYGNIKCSKRFIVNLDNEKTIINHTALDVDGDTNITGKLNVNSYIKVDEYIEATKGVRSISDKRVKTDLKVIENSLDKIKKLTGYTFKRTDIILDKLDTGLIAQDVQSVLPEVISIDNNNMLNIEYNKMMGLIIEAIKELDNKINLIK